MNRIDKLIAEHCPEGVEHKPLGEVGQFIRGTGLQKKDFVETGVGCIHYGQIYTYYGTSTNETKSFVAPELAARLRRARTGDLVLATTSENLEDVCKAVAWLGDSEIAVSGDAYIYRHSLDPLYAAYLFQTAAFEGQKSRFVTGTKVKRVSGDALARIKVPVPPVAVQKEIVQVLAAMEELEASLEAELEARRLQFSAYRTRLVNPDVDSDVEFVQLGELFDARAGRAIPASEISESPESNHVYPCFGGNGVRGFVANASHSGSHIVIGRVGAQCGNVQRAEGQFFVTDLAIVLSLKRGVRVELSWVFHSLVNAKLNRIASRSAQPALSLSKLRKFAIPILPISLQTEISSMLDKFDMLVTDAYSGIPAEITARRKQYEYYRDKLLTFPEAAA